MPYLFESEKYHTGISPYLLQDAKEISSYILFFDINEDKVEKIIDKAIEDYIDALDKRESEKIIEDYGICSALNNLREEEPDICINDDIFLQRLIFYIVKEDCSITCYTDDELVVLLDEE
jgi:hypothetical protein